ncbi:glycosyltransferase family 39 protein [Modestobacter sp. KNN46-3]|jgi:hypothetical protein|uniref:glycosyltransferase family 39 protein n=1 Tax=Modestobacter sp. KNN46-3 TaxID=2711218 RepID=UPI0013E08BF8|nr:glycosyltransferase family 39 protein [Modestobacter sp. KNN46-3]
MTSTEIDGRAEAGHQHDVLAEETGPGSTTSTGSHAARTGGRFLARARNSIAWWGALVVTSALFVLHIAIYNPLSPVDEIQHIDYVLHLLDGNAVGAGDTFTEEGQDILACRWIDTAAPLGMPCGGPYDLSRMPGGGYDTAYIHAPFYYVTPAVAALAGSALGVDGDLVNVMRFSSVLWWALFVGIAWRLFRELGVHKWVGAAGILVLAASPVILQTFTIVNNDVTALPAGAALTLAALRWDRGLLGLRWLVLIAAVAVAIKSTNVTMVIAVALFVLARHWQGTNPRSWREWLPSRRPLLAIVALGVTSAVVGLAWTVVQAQLQTMDPLLVPQNQSFFAPSFEPMWLISSMDAFFTPINPEFYDTTLTGDTARLVAVLTDYGLITLTILGAVMAARGSQVRALAFALGGTALFVPMLLIIVNYEAVNIFVLITSRYGLSLVPAALAIGLTMIRPKPARVAFAAVAVASAAGMAHTMLT